MNSKLEKISLEKKDKKHEQEDYFSDVWKKNWDIYKIHNYILHKLTQIDIQKNLYKQKINFLKDYEDPYLQLEIYRLNCELDYLSLFPSKEDYQTLSVYYLYKTDWSKDKEDKKEIKNTYLRNLTFLYYPINGITNINKKYDENTISKCCKETLEVNKESEWICPNCGLIYFRNLENTLELQSYNAMKEIIPSIRKKPVYKKAGHLQEKINQKLGFCKNFVPDEVMKKIKKQLKNEKIIELSKLKPEDIRRILKKLGLEKYYEMDYNIFSEITGTKIIQFDPSLISKIENMFDEVVIAFETIKNKNRTSMFVYDYTIHKLLELLDLNIYKRYFKPPKNPEKVVEYDRLWKKICQHLSWKFIPTSINY